MSAPDPQVPEAAAVAAEPAQPTASHTRRIDRRHAFMFDDIFPPDTSVVIDGVPVAMSAAAAQLLAINAHELAAHVPASAQVTAPLISAALTASAGHGPSQPTGAVPRDRTDTE